MDVLDFLKSENRDGDGSGCGRGYGSGRGNGSGNGSGYGNGRGSGSGDGSGDGSGNGRGYGNGYGSGYGDGNGSGYGSGIKKYKNHFIYNIDSISTIITNLHGNVAKGFILRKDLHLIPCYVVKSNNLFAHGNTLKDAQKSLEDKIFEKLDTDEKIAEFQKQFASGKKYPVKEFYNWHHKLTGSCEMGREQFAIDHNIDVETGEMTVQEFVELTKNSFGGEIISQLEAGGGKND